MNKKCAFNRILHLVLKINGDSSAVSNLLLKVVAYLFIKISMFISSNCVVCMEQINIRYINKIVETYLCDH